MDPISVLAGGVIFLAGVLTGRRVRRPTTTIDLQPPVCTCAHGYGTHDKGARCQAQVERRHYMEDGRHNGSEWAPCRCLSYDGPEPLPRVWTPEAGQ